MPLREDDTDHSLVEDPTATQADFARSIRARYQSWTREKPTNVAKVDAMTLNVRQALRLIPLKRVNLGRIKIRRLHLLLRGTIPPKLEELNATRSRTYDLEGGRPLDLSACIY